MRVRQPASRGYGGSAYMLRGQYQGDPGLSGVSYALYRPNAIASLRTAKRENHAYR